MMVMRKIRRSGRSGFSLLELAIVLTLMAGLISGVWAVSTNARNANMARVLHQQVVITHQKVQAYFSNRPLPSTVADRVTNYTTATMRAAGVFSEDMCPANCIAGTITTIYNTYGGSTTFSLPGLGPPTPNLYELTLQAVQQRGCVQLGMMLSAKSAELGLTKYRVGNVGITSFPISLSTLDSQCSSSTAGNTIVITLKIRNQ